MFSRILLVAARSPSRASTFIDALLVIDKKDDNVIWMSFQCSSCLRLLCYGSRQNWSDYLHEVSFPASCRGPPTRKPDQTKQNSREVRVAATSHERNAWFMFSYTTLPNEKRPETPWLTIVCYCIANVLRVFFSFSDALFRLSDPFFYNYLLTRGCAAQVRILGWWITQTLSSLSVSSVVILFRVNKFVSVISECEPVDNFLLPACLSVCLSACLSYWSWFVPLT